MKPPNAPNNAIPFGPDPPGMPGVTSNVIASIQTNISRENSVAASNFQGTCTDWLANVPRDQALGVPVPPKPVAPNGQALYMLADTDPSTGVIWVWQIDGAPVGVCPDPPAQSTPQPNHIHVGVSLGGGWWSTGADDTFPPGKNTPPVTSDDGTTGVFEKFGAPVGTGWYLKQG